MTDDSHAVGRRSLSFLKEAESRAQSAAAVDLLWCVMMLGCDLVLFGQHLSTPLQVILLLHKTEAPRTRLPVARRAAEGARGNRRSAAGEPAEHAAVARENPALSADCRSQPENGEEAACRLRAQRTWRFDSGGGSRK